MSVTYPKGEPIVWNCVKDHIINEKEGYIDIGLSGFDYKSFSKMRVGGLERDYTGILI